MMNHWTLILTHMIVAFLSGMLGYVVGFEVCARRNHDSKSRADQGVVLYCLVGVSLLLAGFSAYQGKSQDEQRLACFNAYANQAADALDARQKVTEEREQAVAKVFRVTAALMDHRATQAQFQRSIDQYVEADKQLNEQRDKNPFPDPPRKVCK